MLYFDAGKLAAHKLKLLSLSIDTFIVIIRLIMFVSNHSHVGLCQPNPILTLQTHIDLPFVFLPAYLAL